MWIFTSEAYLSIVEDRNDAGRLLVRARFKGDIERVFGDEAAVEETPKADYRFRASLPRDRVARVIAHHIGAIRYDNFKNSVKAPHCWRKSHLMRVWGVMNQEQSDRRQREVSDHVLNIAGYARFGGAA